MASIRGTEELAASLMEKHGLTGWTFVWDNARSRGGQCDYNFRRISMSRHLVPKWTEAQVFEVLMHELSHALVGPGHGHGRVWAAQMIALGRDPKRTHDNEIVAGRYVAICDACGVEVARRHRMGARMRDGRLLHAKCRTVVRWVDTEQVSV